jgi:hypothetical protein
VIIYTRGDRIPEGKRDRRFFYDGRPSAIALKKYWRLLPDGSPDPACTPYRRRWEIDMHHRAYPEMGEYRIDADLPGRNRQRKGSRADYQKEYFQSRKKDK